MIILVGDYAPGNKHVNVTCNKGIMLCNLEGPVLPSSLSFSMRPKAGPNLFSSELPDSNIQFVYAMANNHIMDFGMPGLSSTQTLLKQRGFKSCGAGNDIKVARQSIIIEDNGARVGVISCCEAQFGVATQNRGGVADFGPWVYKSIRDLCQKTDEVIVSVHAAVEDSPWPSPYIRELYKSFIDAGAKVVHGHHSHIPQGYEAYGNGMIFYGMGNFAVDPNKWSDYPNGLWSLAAEIDFSSKPMSCRIFTLEIRKQASSDTIKIEESNEEENASHKSYLEICNRPFKDTELFGALWQEVALRVYNHYGAIYMGFSAPNQSRLDKIRAGLSTIKRALFNRIAFSSYPNQRSYILWHVMIVCESHRQMLSTALGVLGGEIKDLRTKKTKQLLDEMMP